MDLVKKRGLFLGLLKTFMPQVYNRNYLHHSGKTIYSGFGPHPIRFLSKEGMNNSVQKGRRLTVGQYVHILTLSFQDEGIRESRSSAEYIIAHALGQKTLCTVPLNKILDETIISKITHYAKLRKQKFPVQYIIGEWDFMELTLVCAPPVFIPRPETEELVGHALGDPVVQKACHIIEVGCGTGAISISLLTRFPQLNISAVEISREACELTLLNAQNYKTEDRLNIINTRFTSDMSLRDIGLDDKVDALISNPPYVPQQAIKHLQPEVTMFEDHIALDGGQDGLSVIKDILQVAALLVKPEGSLWLEVDASHPSVIETIVNSVSSLKLHYVKTYNDFCNRYESNNLYHSYTKYSTNYQFII